ncbi:MAG: tRNA (5-methylaminomethyl-2-thiouridine)(34)-methyltransferase MnmD [Bacteroidales bacterium]
MDLEVVHTADSSLTLYNKVLDEHYHSVHGARNESLHVFIKNGLEESSASPINIYEVGFGTGLNAMLAMEWAEKNKQKINYITVEKYPIPKDLIKELSKQGNIDRGLYNRIHDKKCIDRVVSINEYADFQLIHADCKTLDLSPLPYFDLIFFDAFAPDKEVDDKGLWGMEHFQKIYNHTKVNGIFVTYCAKGAVRRSLAQVGFRMERLPGPVGKREMLRGRKLRVDEVIQ